MIALALLAGLIVLVIARHKAPLRVDARLHGWMLAHRTPTLTTAAIAVTNTGTGVPAYVVAALAGGLAAGRSRWWAGAAAAVATLTVGQLIRYALVLSIDRPRPPAADWAWHAGGPALPSGHTTTSALVAGLVCLALSRQRERRVRVVGSAVALGWAAAVGLTRVYLGMHWPTDVVAGWLLAAALILTVGRPALAGSAIRSSPRPRHRR